jgi:hypothetical protein
VTAAAAAAVISGEEVDADELALALLQVSDGAV